MKIKIRIDGKDELIKRVGKYTKEQALEIDKALWAVGGQITMQAKNNCRSLFDHPTGRLMGSITMASTWGKATSPAAPAKGADAVSAPVERISHAVVVGTNVVYARRVELGFVGLDKLGRNYNQAAKPYLYPAYFSIAPSLKAKLKEAFRKKPGTK